MYRIGMFLLAFTCVAALPAVDLRPDEVTITMKSGDSKVYAVFANNVDKVAVGQTMKDLKPASSLDWKRIKSLDYGTKWRGGEYSRALGAMFREDYAAAVESFLKTKDGKSQMLQVQSHRQLAEAYAGLKKYDEAIAALNELIQKFPKHRNNAEVVFEIGKLQLAKADLASTEKTAVRLDGMSEWMPSNVANAAMLRANIAKQSNDDVKAVTVIQGALGKINGEDSPEAMAGLVYDLTNILMKTGKSDELIKVASANQWWPHSNGDISGGIHFNLAKAYKAKGEFSKAFHHLALGAGTSGTSSKFSTDVKNEARAVVREIKAANEGDEAMLKPYTKALSKF